ncbi:hypothetical protein ACOMHN_000753 [Nucella lapillus]
MSGADEKVKMTPTDADLQQPSPEEMPADTRTPADTHQSNPYPTEKMPPDSLPQSVSEEHSQVEREEGPEVTASNRMNYDLEPSSHGAFHMEEDLCVDPAMVQQLTDGFIQRFLPTLEKSKSSVSEILNNQTVVIETLEQENAKFKDCTAHLDLCQMMGKAKTYHSKLLTVRRDMAALHDKAAKLKRRALKLQQQRQKEELQRAHQQERELEKEHMLTAKVASPES